MGELEKRRGRETSLGERNASCLARTFTCWAKLWKSCSMSAARSLWRQLNVPNMFQIICRARPLNRGSSLRSSVFMVLAEEAESENHLCCVFVQHRGFHL